MATFKTTKNLAKSVLAVAYTAGDSTVTLRTGDGALFEPVGDAIIRMESAPPFFLRYTAVTGDVLTVSTTGQEGTTAVNLAIGKQVTNVVTAGMLSGLISQSIPSGLLTSGTTDPAVPNIALVHSGVGGVTPYSTGISVSLGNYLLVAHAGNGTGTSSISDNLGNIYTLIGTSTVNVPAFSRDATVYLWGSVITVAGALTLTQTGTFGITTVNNPGANNGGNLFFAEFSGVDPVTPFSSSTTGTNFTETFGALSAGQITFMAIAQAFFNIEDWVDVSPTVTIQQSAKVAAIGSSTSNTVGFTVVGTAPSVCDVALVINAKSTGTPGNDGNWFLNTITGALYQQIASNWTFIGFVINPSTTKGDVVVFDGTSPARLAVGADGDVLTANSAALLGVDWEPAGGGGGGTDILGTAKFDLISGAIANARYTGNVSGATYTTTGKYAIALTGSPTDIVITVMVQNNSAANLWLVQNLTTGGFDVAVLNITATLLVDPNSVYVAIIKQ